jgi:hypothetical protein
MAKIYEQKRTNRIHRKRAMKTNWEDLKAMSRKDKINKIKKWFDTPRTNFVIMNLTLKLCNDNVKLAGELYEQAYNEKKREWRTKK